jgi:protein-S-isoprenylcysteine O-methyltransferase Ste14
MAIACISSSSASLALRSLFWTVAFPGMVAGYVPWRFFGFSEAQVDWRRPPHVLGLLCIVIGTLLLAACIVEFAKSGRGTLSPADPPRHLVVRGLYRHVRNPMYLSVTMILLGEAVLMQSRDLAIYWIIWFVAANLFVIGCEEPMLRQRFGDAYDDYTRQVGRWVPRLRS